MLGIILIIIGAVLVWAVSAHVNGFNLDTIGWILLVVGALELLFELLIIGWFRNRWNDIGRGF